MNKHPSLWFALALSASLAGCSRHSSRKEIHPRDSNAVAARAGALAPTHALLVVAERPSPFVPAPLLEAPTPVASVATTARAAPATRHSKRTKTFTVPAALRSHPARAADPPLPAAPALVTAAPAAVVMPFRGSVCCAATATFEVSRPKGLQRLISGVPGFRRLARSGGGQFVPPQPLHTIQMALPPDASPALMETGRLDLKAWLDASGRVIRVELLAPRDERLADLAGYGASGWQFRPAEWNNHPVASDIVLHFRFNSGPTAKDTAGAPSRP